MSGTLKKYGISFTTSLAGHLLLFLFLFSTILFTTNLPDVVKRGSSEKIVHAVVINQTQVEQEVKRLKEQQAEKKQKESERIAHLQQLANQARTERENELKRLQQLKLKQENLQKQQALEQEKANERLADIKQQQVIQQDRLKQLEQKQAKASENYQLQQQKLQALQKRQEELAQQKAQKAKALLAQQLKQEQAALAKAKQQYINGVINKYNALIVQAISKNWITPPNVNKTLNVTFQVQLSTSGKVENVIILKSSGDQALDQSAILAVYKASPLPIPADNPSIAKQFSEFSLTMNPSESTASG